MNRVEQLGDEARALIEATRDAYDPTASNRAQVRWGVDRRLSSEPVVRVSMRHQRVVVALATAAIVIAGVSVAAAFVWRSVAANSERVEVARATEAAPPRPPAPRVLARPTAEEPPATAESAEPVASPATPAPRKSVHVTRPSGDLSAETTLIARAQAATNRGDGDEALQLLEQYDRQFSEGALAEERAASRIFALCSSGQREVARAEADRFLARWPRSPQAARVRSACREAKRP